MPDLRAHQVSGNWLAKRAVLIEEARRKRGAVSPSFALGGRASSIGGSALGGLVSGHSSGSRTMAERFAGLARGGQSSVVKLTSYGGAGRLGSMVNYISREGEVAVENEFGLQLSGREQLAGLKDEWDHLLSDRADSRDIGAFKVELAFREAGPHDHDQLHVDVREVLNAAYGGRKYVYGLADNADGKIRVEGLVMLRHADGERLTGDAVANEIVKARFAGSEVSNKVDAEFRFAGHGNGVEFGSSRLRSLTDAYPRQVHDQGGKLIASHDEANRLMQREWRHELHSRKARDVMHVMVSARAGTDVEQFRNAARDFLGKQFAGHRYVWAVHDPAEDPKDAAAGGKRPHVHAHAVITMRSDYGDRARPTIETFRQWRQGMAEAARSHGIAMEMTDRRELATAPAYTKTQVRPVYDRGRTHHAGTSEASQIRYERKRVEVPTYPSSEKSRSYSERAQMVWRTLSEVTAEKSVRTFANNQGDRIMSAQKEVGIVQTSAPSTSGNSNERRQPITRERFEAYEKRALDELKRASANIGLEHREAFDKSTKAVLRLIETRRMMMEAHEALSQPSKGRPEQREEAGAGHVAKPVRAPDVHDRGREVPAEQIGSSEKSPSKEIQGQDGKGEAAKPAKPHRGRGRGRDDFELG